MNQTEIRWLLSCAALAAGEILAARLPSGAEAWPYFALATAWVALVGYGFAVRGWRWAFLVLAGITLFYFSTVENERIYRESPWMRDARRHREETTPFALKADLSRRVGIGLEHDRETVVLNRAILLGERDGIPKTTKQTFVESGTIHVFAISGLHVMIVAKVLMFFVACLFVPLRLQGAIALLPVWGYVVLIGSPPSAIRAALMATICFAAPLCWRRPNGVVAWSLAFFIVHIVFPELIADTGSQLSHVVMLAIIVAGRISRGTFFVTFAAWAAGLPIAAMAFGRITPGGLVANLVLIATAAYSVVAGAVGALVSYVSVALAVHLNNLSALMTDAMVCLSETVARLPGANFEIDPWDPLMCAEWYVALGLFFFLVHHVRARRNLI